MRTENFISPCITQVFVVQLLLASLACDVALGQTSPTRRFSNQTCTTGPTCPYNAPFPSVTVTTDATTRYIQTTGCPPYTNPGWITPNGACMVSVTVTVPLKPAFALIPIPVGELQSVYLNVTYLKDNPAPALGKLGVFVSGVFIYGPASPCGVSSPCPQASNASGIMQYVDPKAPSNYVDAVQSEGQSTDACAGHGGPGGNYHIHSGLGINTTAQRVACGLPPDTPDNHSVLLGWMFDGIGLYGRYSQNGIVPTQLDSCNGHTHLIDGVLTYHYHIPDGFPWTVGCFKGCPRSTNNPFTFSTSTYGCPTGVAVDPNPLYETVSGPTAGTQSQTGSSSSSSSSGSPTAAAAGKTPQLAAPTVLLLLLITTAILWF